MADGEANAAGEAGHDSQLDRLAEVIDAETANGDEAGAGLARILLSEKYRGSFSPPSHLREFDEIVENGAERAFSVTEKEQQHRHRCDEKIVDAEVESRQALAADRRLLIILSFIAIMIGIAGGVALAVIGYPVAAGVLGGGAALATLGGALFAKRKSSEIEK